MKSDKSAEQNDILKTQMCFGSYSNFESSQQWHRFVFENLSLLKLKMFSYVVF